MAIEDIVQRMIAQLGQSQDERYPAEFADDYVRLDERSPSELLALTRALAQRVVYRPARQPDAPIGDWQPLFNPKTGLPQDLRDLETGLTPPHLALFATFLRLYEAHAQQRLNALRDRHLDFYYRRILGFGPRAARADGAHVLLELKPQAAPLAIDPEHAFNAGKDAAGRDVIYRPIGRTVINHAKVASLRSIYRDSWRIRCAPIADSSDGLGTALNPAAAHWPAFGHAALPAAEVGFAVASPLLRLRQGNRTILLKLTLDRTLTESIDAKALHNALRARISGPTGWLDIDLADVALEGKILRLQWRLSADEPAIVDHDPARHGLAVAVKGPVLCVSLSGSAGPGYNLMENWRVERLALDVSAEELSPTRVENDTGTVDPSKPFQPFGAQPVTGARCVIDHGEMLHHAVQWIKLRAHWKGLPADLKSHYDGYVPAVKGKDDFTVDVSFRDGRGTMVKIPQQPLFAGDEGVLTFQWVRGSAAPPLKRSQWHRWNTLRDTRSDWSLRAFERAALLQPITARLGADGVAADRPTSTSDPQTAAGINLTLNNDLRHQDYTHQAVAHVAAVMRKEDGATLLKPPYTPVIASLRLDYGAAAEPLDLGGDDLNSFANADLQFFHLAPFGQRRDHRYQRNQLSFVGDKAVPLLPEFPHDGELLVGLAGIGAGDSINLLIEVEPGSAEPDLPRARVEWSVLCDNYWVAFKPDEIIRDGTDGLLTSGVVGMVIPPSATTQNSFMPAGWLWLRATLDGAVASVCRVKRIAANGVELRYAAETPATADSQGRIEAGRIAKLVTPMQGVKSILQPSASFGGVPPEEDAAMNTRVAERLRHRNRALSAWDYERLVLANFPAVQIAKCIPHARGGQWLQPGWVTMVVVPQLSAGITAVRPKVDAVTLARIEQFLLRRTGAQVGIEVKNPRYQAIQIACKVRFAAGMEFNFHRRLLQDALKNHLSPWTRQDGDIAAPRFGGVIHGSEVLDFIEAQPYVDYVTDFRMLLLSSGGEPDRTVPQAQADSPDTVLATADRHLIAPAD